MTLLSCFGFRALIIFIMVMTPFYAYLITRKMVPITGQASSFIVFLEFSKTKNKIERRGGQNKNKRPINQGYNILNRLQVHHLTFIMHNKYI